MSSDSLKKFGAAIIANAINSYKDSLFDTHRIISTEEVLQMSPISYTNSEHDDNDVYAINNRSDTILAHVNAETGKIRIEVIKWWNESDKIPTELLTRISDFMGEKDCKQLWIYPDSIVEKQKSGAEFKHEIDISAGLLRALHPILKNLLQNVAMDDYDEKNPCIHINKFFK